VDATLSDRRYRVEMSRTVGKAEKSRAFLVNSETNSTSTESVMLKASSRSSSTGFSGSTSTMMMLITPIARSKSILRDARENSGTLVV